MKPIRSLIEGQEKILACAHWRNFPPVVAFSDLPVEDLRSRKLIKETDYQRYQIWLKICSRLTMDLVTCLKCPHARTAEFVNGIPMLITLDRKSSVPTVDLATMESNFRPDAPLVQGMIHKHLPKRMRFQSGNDNG